MPSTKYAGLSYPTHYLKSRDSVIRNNFLECRANKTPHFARRKDCYALLAINKANHILNKLFRAPARTQFIVKVRMNKNRKKSYF